MKSTYSRYDPKSKEAFNMAQLGAVLARKQEFLLPLRFDSNGADALAYNPLTNTTRAIQLKARVSINKKYTGKNIWIAFPDWIGTNRQDWYLILHDELVNLWGPSRLNTLNEGQASGKLSKDLIRKLVDFKVGSIELS